MWFLPTEGRLGVRSAFVGVGLAMVIRWLPSVSSSFYFLCFLRWVNVVTVKKLRVETKKVEDDEADAQKELFVLQTKMAAAVGRLARLSEMKRSLRTRSADLISRGLKSLEDESELHFEEMNVVEDLQSMGVPDAPDWSSFGLGDDFARLGSLSAIVGDVVVEPARLVETPEVSAGSGSGA